VKAFPPWLVLQIEYHAALVTAIGEPKQTGLRPWLIVPKRRPVSSWIAAGRLHRDDIGAEIREQAAAQKGAAGGEIQDAKAAEHARCFY
jgi:hypothetical protein